MEIAILMRTQSSTWTWTSGLSISSKSEVLTASGAVWRSRDVETLFKPVRFWGSWCTAVQVGPACKGFSLFSQS